MITERFINLEFDIKITMAEWKGAAPLLALLFAVAAFTWAGVPVAGFWGYVTIAAAWLLVVPVLSTIGIGKEVNKWFVSAGAFGLFSASFALLTGLTSSLAVFSQKWAVVLVDIGLILSWITALIGSLTVVSKSFAK